MELIVGASCLFLSGVGFGWLLTWRYVSSLGWEQEAVPERLGPYTEGLPRPPYAHIARRDRDADDR